MANHENSHLFDPQVSECCMEVVDGGQEEENIISTTEELKDHAEKLCRIEYDFSMLVNRLHQLQKSMNSTR